MMACIIHGRDEKDKKSLKGRNLLEDLEIIGRLV
jgi:hypothetical protein